MNTEIKELNVEMAKFISSIGKGVKKDVILLNIRKFSEKLEDLSVHVPENSPEFERINHTLHQLRQSIAQPTKISELRTAAELAVTQLKKEVVGDKLLSRGPTKVLFSETKSGLKKLTEFSDSDIKLVGLAFSICSAFMIGAMSELGLGILPIIDKIDAFVLLSFYVGAFFVASKIAVNAYMAYQAMADDLTSELKIRKRFTKLPHIIVLILILLLFTASLLNIDNYDNIYLILENLYKSEILLKILFVIFVAVFCFVSFYFLSNRIKRSIIKKSNDYMISFAALVGSFYLGVIWIEILEFRSREKVIVYSKSIKNDRATIVMRANNGIIAFLNSDDHPTYISWGVIQKIHHFQHPTPKKTYYPDKSYTP